LIDSWDIKIKKIEEKEIERIHSNELDLI
jgi:hypothetical protein